MRCRRVVHAEVAAGEVCLAASPAAVRQLHALAAALLSAVGGMDSGKSSASGSGRAPLQPDPRQQGPGLRQPSPGIRQPAGRVAEGLPPPAVPAPVLALQVSMPSLSLRLAASEEAGVQDVGPPMLRAVACGLSAALAAEANQLDLRCAAKPQIDLASFEAGHGRSEWQACQQSKGLCAVPECCYLGLRCGCCRMQKSATGCARGLRRRALCWGVVQGFGSIIGGRGYLHESQ